jgi:hypothetical protein
MYSRVKTTRPLESFEVVRRYNYDVVAWRQLTDKFPNHQWVDMGEGKVSEDETPLISQGFTVCSGLILQQPRKESCALFHFAGNIITQQQEKIIDHFDPAEHTQASFVLGKLSLDLEVVLGTISDRFGLPLADIPYFRYEATGDRFELAYDPREQTAYLNTYGIDDRQQPTGGPHIIAFDPFRSTE